MDYSIDLIHAGTVTIYGSVTSSTKINQSIGKPDVLKCCPALHLCGEEATQAPEISLIFWNKTMTHPQSFVLDMLHLALPHHFLLVGHTGLFLLESNTCNH